MNKQSVEKTLKDFHYLDLWEDKYRYLIDLGKSLPPLQPHEMTAQYKVQGCASQVWLVSEEKNGHLIFRAQSDAHIVRGLIALLIQIYSHQTPQHIINTDAHLILKQIGLHDHLTPQRSNGFASMINKIKDIAIKKNQNFKPS